MSSHISNRALGRRWLRGSAALACFTASGESHMVAACQHRLGELLGGNQGDELIAGAASWMSGQGVKNPARMLALLTWP